MGGVNVVEEVEEGSRGAGDAVVWPGSEVVVMDRQRW